RSRPIGSRGPSIWKNRLGNPDTHSGRPFLSERSRLNHLERATRPTDRARIKRCPRGGSGIPADGGRVEEPEWARHLYYLPRRRPRKAPRWSLPTVRRRSLWVDDESKSGPAGAGPHRLGPFMAIARPSHLRHIDNRRRNIAV